MKAALAAAQREHERISRHAQASLDAARTEHARVRREVDQLQAACAAAADKWTTLTDGVDRGDNRKAEAILRSTAARIWLQ